MCRRAPVATNPTATGGWGEPLHKLTSWALRFTPRRTKYSPKCFTNLQARQPRTEEVHTRPRLRLPLLGAKTESTPPGASFPPADTSPAAHLAACALGVEAPSDAVPRHNGSMVLRPNGIQPRGAGQVGIDLATRGHTTAPRQRGERRQANNRAGIVARTKTYHNRKRYTCKK